MAQQFKIEINWDEISEDNIEIAYRLSEAKHNTIEKDGIIKWTKEAFEDSVIMFSEIPESWLIPFYEKPVKGVDWVVSEYKMKDGEWLHRNFNADDMCDSFLAGERNKLLKIKDTIETFKYRINNPSAWQEYSEEGSQVLRALINQLENLSSK